MHTDRLCVVIPVYNEEAVVGRVLEKWSRALDSLGVNYVIRPYNDGSGDRSLPVMREAAARLAHVEIHDKPNGGHGQTILTGYRDAVRDGFDWIFQVDSDDEMGPEKFAELWRLRDSHDFLVGRRTGRRQALPRKIISFASRLAVRLLYGRGRVWDVNAPYRLMRTSAFAPVFARIPPRTFAPNVLVAGMAARNGLRAVEIPVPQHDRTTGVVSIRKWKLLKAAAKSLLQTIMFSQAFFDLAVAALPAVIVLSMLDWTSCLWYDELCMGDGVFMKALHGLTWSGVWPCSYNPLYPVLMVAWTKLFGASHFAFCSFTVLCGFLSSLLLLGIAHRRGFFDSRPADAAFLLIFWGCWHFAWSLSCGRVDVLMLLLTAGFVDALTPHGDRPRSFRAIFSWAFLMMLAAPYMLPVLACFGLLLLAIGRGRRADVALRGVFAALGIGCAFLACCSYYLVQHDLIRFLGSYVYFNSITGYAPAPFVVRLTAGYLYDYAALGLLAGGALFGKLRKSELPLVGFIALIPLLMLLGGRYETYYAWAFFIPCALLGTTAAARHGKWACVVLATVGLSLFAVRQVRVGNSNAGARQNRDACRAFVNRCAKHIPPESDVIVAADLSGNTGFYYPLVQLGARIWYRGPEMLNGRTDREKFTEGLSFVVRTPEQKAKLANFIEGIQRFVPMLPDTGFVMFYSKDDVQALTPLFEKHGYTLSPLEADGPFSLWTLRRRAACPAPISR